MRRITLLTNPDKCNLHCPLCFLNQRGRAFGMDEMPWNVAKAAIDKYAFRPDGTRSELKEIIPSTMGEPLLYAHFDELLKLCRTLDVKINLTTNGTFPGFWGTDAGMDKLLECCSDIKVSSLSSECFGDWKSNVERLMAVRSENEALGRALSSVSLQVTLHKENLEKIPEWITWAKNIGISRIKWNVAVFLSTASAILKERFAIPEWRIPEIRDSVRSLAATLCGSNPALCAGNLFFEGEETPSAENAEMACGFDDELWILPDGSVQHCPNPERRFGNPEAPQAKCANCPMSQSHYRK